MLAKSRSNPQHVVVSCGSYLTFTSAILSRTVSEFPAFKPTARLQVVSADFSSLVTDYFNDDVAKVYSQTSRN